MRSDRYPARDPKQAKEGQRRRTDDRQAANGQVAVNPGRSNRNAVARTSATVRSRTSTARAGMSQASLPSAPPLLEADVRDAVRDYLRARGWTIWYFYQGPGAYSKDGRGVGAMPGIPDMCAMKKQRLPNGQPVNLLIWIELKRPIGGRQSDDQVKRQRECEAAGQVYLLVRSVDDIVKWERSVGIA